MEPFEQDDTNLAILRHLREGRKSFRIIAEDLNLSENTVRARVNRLQEEGILDIRGCVDPDALPGHSCALIGIKMSTVDLVAAGEAFSALKGVVSVRVVTGRYDLIVEVLLNEGFGLLEFYTGEVARVENVQDIETFVVYKGFGQRVPYML